ncbi:MAG TPA: 2-dehydropantoate 2-reductase [Opitutaceae bacterium]
MALAFPRVAVIGSGAIGLYYGARLALGGADVRFQMRSDLAAVKARGSVRLRIQGEWQEASPIQAYATTAEIGVVDLVLIATKTMANESVAESLPPLLQGETALLTLQNGLGADEFFAARFSAARVLGGLAFIANNRSAPGDVICFHPGSLTLGQFGGPPNDRLRALAEQFIAAGVKTQVADNLASARWHKLVWNIPFNGLSIAAGGLTTDRLCSDPGWTSEVRALMREVQSAAAALGFSIRDEFLQAQYDVTPPMGEYRPSSLVDFEAGREVEVEPIWGEPLRRARAAEVAVPHLERLYSLLCELCRVRPSPLA